MNKNKFIKIVFALALVSNFNINAQQANENNNKTKISVEIDPVTFVFNGFSAHLRIQPKNSDHLLLGVGVYSMDMPDVFVDFNESNKGKGWDVRLNQGYGLFGEHHFSEVNRKWFVGGQVALQQYKIEKESISGSEKFTNILLMAYGGYTWQLFDSNFYVKPWAGFGYTSKIAGNNTLGNSEYDISPITMFATFHIGYTF